MDNTINITDKLVIKSLEMRVARLEAEIRLHLQNVANLRADSMSYAIQADRLKQENEELKKLLKSLDVGITYG